METKGPGNMQQLDLFTDTRRAAHKKARVRANTLKERCLDVLTLLECTADEVAINIHESILSVRPRISELAQEGLIIDTGLRRTNDSGTLATVWRAK